MAMKLGVFVDIGITNVLTE